MTEKPEAGGVVTVAELLAKHGQSSATGGRAHRRRAREGGITVAELTGEIPVVRDAPDDAPEAAVEDAPEAEAPAAPEAADASEAAETEAPAATHPMALESQPAESQPAEPEPVEAYSLSAVADAGPQSPREFASATDSPVMTPLAGSIMSAEAPAAPAAPESAAGEYTPPAEAPADEPAEKGAVRQWLALVSQAVIGVAVGAALFVGFEKLWDALPYVALVLAILVILALVAVVRILRKTDDTVSMLIAVVVGVIVTIGPLAFVLSTS